MSPQFCNHKAAVQPVLDPKVICNQSFYWYNLIENKQKIKHQDGPVGGLPLQSAVPFDQSPSYIPLYAAGIHI